ncbi:MAG TPA: RNA methyltransferase [Chloroflexi bacterium]|nr:MAG: RNA methyltransferase [Chloroflexota bacterium]HDD54890.1 RNA methyltransferase [Chloroflexota bacterium]
MITSRQNPKIKHIRKLNSGSKFREQAGAFVAEGIRLLEETRGTALKPGWVIYTEDLDRRGEKLLDYFRAQQVPCEPVTPEVLEAASDTETPQGVLGVFPLISLPFPPALRLLVILDSLRDPGNLGTLMRTSLAAGADGLLLSPGSVDPFSPKVVRSAMGAHFKLPVRTASWSEIAELAGEMTLLLADMGNGTSFWEVDLTGPVGIILGSEAHGPGEEARKLANQTIHIPISSSIESLNAAAAGAVLLFEVNRQRRRTEKPNF